MSTKTFFISFLISTCIGSTYAQHKDLCKKINRVNALIQEHHIKPKPLNDSLSVYVWKGFIEALDPSKTYFLQSDIKAFEKDKYKLDDYFKKGKCAFIKSYIQTLKLRLKESENTLRNLQTTTLKYPKEDSLFFDAKRGRKYSKDENEQQEDWQWFVRYQTLKEAIKRYDDKAKLLADFETIKPDIKNYVIDRALCAIDEIQQHPNGFDEYVNELFLNALSTVNDPHSVYFNSSEKSAFDTSLSTNSLSFGIWTDKNDEGQIYISYINSNSPAAFDDKIEAGDILRSLETKNAKLQTSCISNQEVINFLSDENHQDVDFEIEKSRGQIKTVSLTKTNIPIEYNAVDTFIIDGEEKAAYINIPSFYVNTESPDGRGTSLDLGKALYKLMRDNVGGLIIDLRQNGGGSMKEAADLVNIFVDGPFAILKHKDEMLTIYNDKSATFFKKPIVIMVDAYTASAAELFAGVMQDYNRAVIVGSDTYGKATSQYIYELDPDKKDDGFLKITMEKFYRISGKSHQMQGVKPDIYISNLYDGIAGREIDEKHALKPDTLNISESIKAFELPIETLKQNSIKRQNESEIFQNVKAFNAQLKTYVFDKKIAYPFQLTHVYDDTKSYDKMWDDMYKQLEGQSFIKLQRTTFDQKFEKEKDKKRMDMIMQYTAEDPAVYESYLILKDLMMLKSETNP